jgi:hypothetical protein
MRQLAARTSCPLLLTGGPDEIELVEAIREACPVPALSLAGQLSLGQLGAALRLASVVVSNNTGPAHIAAAVGTPLVDLYALTNPQHTPWHVTSRLLYHDVPCRFCQKSECPEGHHACLDQVDPGRVADAVCSLLDTDTDTGCARPHPPFAEIRPATATVDMPFPGPGNQTAAVQNYPGKAVSPGVPEPFGPGVRATFMIQHTIAK